MHREHSMKQYIFDGSVRQQADVICYAFSPDLLDASTTELLGFLTILSQHFPKTDNGDGEFRPMDNRPLIDTFNSAHRHVCELIAAKRAEARHRWLLGVSIATFLVLAITLANTLFIQSAEGNQSSPTVNQSSTFGGSITQWRIAGSINMTLLPLTTHQKIIMHPPTT